MRREDMLWLRWKACDSCGTCILCTSSAAACAGDRFGAAKRCVVPLASPFVDTELAGKPLLVWENDADSWNTLLP